MFEVYYDMERVARFFCAYCFDQHYFDMFRMDWDWGRDAEDLLYIRFEARNKTRRFIDRFYQIKEFGAYKHLQNGVETVGLKRKQFETLNTILTDTCGINEWAPFEGVEWIEKDGFSKATLFDNGELFLEVERYNYNDIGCVDTIEFGWKYNKSVTKKEHRKYMRGFFLGSDYPFDEADFFMSKEDATKIKSALVWLLDNSKLDEKKNISILNDGI